MNINGHPPASVFQPNTIPNLNLVSFNVNGLGQAGKRSVVFNSLKQLKCISLLQEIHCIKKDETRWENNWDGKIFFSNGSINNKGVAILIPSNIDFELCEKKCDDEGRMLIVKLKIQSNTYVLFNIYAPTQDGHKLEQNIFINKFKLELSPFTNENILIGGDFNFCMDSKLDNMDSMSNRNDNPIYRKDICALLESMDLTDCFRNIYPNLRR